MQNDKICSDIVSALARTRTEANMFLNELDLLLRSLYIVGTGDFIGTMESAIRAKTALALTPILNENNREEVLAELKKQTESLNYFGLTIAFEPTLEIIAKISSWVRQNVDPQIALDITVNKSILGGAEIEYNGKVGSFTIRSHVDEYFLNNVNL